MTTSLTGLGLANLDPEQSITTLNDALPETEQLSASGLALLESAADASTVGWLQNADPEKLAKTLQARAEDEPEDAEAVMALVDAVQAHRIPSAEPVPQAVPIDSALRPVTGSGVRQGATIDSTRVDKEDGWYVEESLTLAEYRQMGVPDTVIKKMRSAIELRDGTPSVPTNRRFTVDDLVHLERTVLPSQRSGLDEVWRCLQLSPVTISMDAAQPPEFAPVLQQSEVSPAPDEKLVIDNLEEELHVPAKEAAWKAALVREGADGPKEWTKRREPSVVTFEDLWKVRDALNVATQEQRQRYLQLETELRVPKDQLTAEVTLQPPGTTTKELGRTALGEDGEIRILLATKVEYNIRRQAPAAGQRAPISLTAARSHRLLLQVPEGVNVTVRSMQDRGQPAKTFKNKSGELAVVANLADGARHLCVSKQGEPLWQAVVHLTGVDLRTADLSRYIGWDIRTEEDTLQPSSTTLNDNKSVPVVPSSELESPSDPVAAMAAIVSQTTSDGMPLPPGRYVYALGPHEAHVEVLPTGYVRGFVRMDGADTPIGPFNLRGGGYARQQPESDGYDRVELSLTTKLELGFRTSTDKQTGNSWLPIGQHKYKMLREV